MREFTEVEATITRFGFLILLVVLFVPFVHAAATAPDCEIISSSACTSRTGWDAIAAVSSDVASGHVSPVPDHSIISIHSLTTNSETSRSLSPR